MMHIHHQPKRVVVTLDDDTHALGTMKYQTGLGMYVIHIDGELAEHPWHPDRIEFLDWDDQNLDN